MTDDITAASIAKMAAQLGVLSNPHLNAGSSNGGGLKGPLPGSAKPRFPLPDIEIEDVPVDGKMHCRLHMVWKGDVIRSQNHTPGPELDALITEAQKLGFTVIRGVGKRRRRRF